MEDEVVTGVGVKTKTTGHTGEFASAEESISGQAAGTSSG